MNDLFPEVSRRSPQTGDSDNWFTPLSLFFKLSEEFGPFTVDVAGHARAPVSQKIGKFYDQAADGLAQSWAGERVWNNCPYSSIGPWVERAHHEAAGLVRSKHAQIVVQLLPAWTDRGWWADWVEPFRDGPNALVTTRFLRRQKFGTPADPYAKGTDQASFASCVLVWRPPFTHPQEKT